MLPDSKTGAKIVYLNRQAVDVIAGHPNRRESGLLFPSFRNPNKPISLGIHWTKIRNRAALPDMRLHDLRHSFASVAIRDSISLMVIGKLLGHALAETTTRYAHLSDEIVADAAERVSGSIVRPEGSNPCLYIRKNKGRKCERFLSDQEFRRISFGLDALEQRGAGEASFAALLSLKDYPDSTAPGLLDALLRLPCQLILTESYAPAERQVARERIDLAVRRLKSARAIRIACNKLHD